MQKNAVTITHLTCLYADDPVLFNINLTVPEGVICAIVGPNGAGKSTLIQSMVGLLKPMAGTVSLLDGTFEANREKIAYIPQHRTVDWDFPLNVLDVVLMGRYKSIGWFRRPKAQDIQKAHEALQQVHLESYADRHIGQLSGGQKQRVFLARALVQEADLYLMDEPFVGVDAITERMIIDVLKKLRSQGKTVIIVHHDLQQLQEYFDWLILLNKNIIAHGPLESTLTKKNIRATYGTLPRFLCIKEE